MFELLDAQHTPGAQEYSFNRVKESLKKKSGFLFFLPCRVTVHCPHLQILESCMFLFLSGKKCRKNVREDCCGNEINGFM